MLTTSFNGASEAPAPLPGLNIELPVEAVPIPSQEELVQKEASLLRVDFQDRVRRNDHSGPWTSCFSTGRGAANYSKASVKKLRLSAPENYHLAVDNFLSSGLRPISFSETKSQKYQNLFYNKPIVVLDYGHGQKFPGKGYETGANIEGVIEAKVVDAVGVQLESILKDELDAVVVTTRTPIDDGFTFSSQTRFADQEKSLQIRTELASHLREKFPGVPVIFLSLHANRAVTANKVPIPEIYGGLVFSYSQIEGGASASIESRKFAKFLAGSYHFRKASEARTDDFAVLRCHPDGTPENPLGGTVAAMVELGFVTNPGDRALFRQILSDDDVARKYAAQIAKGTGLYLDSRKPKLPEVQLAAN